MKHFFDIKSLSELKEAYRTLCKKFHPDLNGGTTTATMQEINAEYSDLLKNGNFDFTTTKTSIDIEESLRDIIEKTVVLKGITVEICGRWVWFTGETLPLKDTLKALGCKWNLAKKAWFWTQDKRTFRKKPWEMEKIRDKFGSMVMEKKNSNGLPA